MNTNDGGPAFPIASDLLGHGCGMTLRDWFAGQVVGVVASSVRSLVVVPQGDGTAEIVDDERWHQKVANESYLLADAMIAERAKAK